MRFRKLRIAFSATCLIACVLLVALWVRSYWYCDDMFGRLYSRSVVALQSSTGRIGFSYMGPTNDLVYEGWSIRNSRTNLGKSARSLVSWSSNFGDTTLVIPHCLAIAVVCVLAIFPWIRWRFTLRTLLIATTLVAVVLGMIAWAVR